MSEFALTHLRHVGTAVPNYEQAVEFFAGVWGLIPVASDGGITFFATPSSPEQYIFRVRKDSQKRLDLVAFGAADTQTVDLLAERLGRAGVTIETEPSTLKTPGGGYGVRFFDCDGRLVEVSCDVEERAVRALEQGESIPQALSHVVINSTDVTKTKAFYEQHLGFKLSDWLEDYMCFMRTNERHHSLAISRGPHTALNHISFEMRGIDEYMRGTGRLMRESGQKPLWGPGRHGAGDNTFSYFLDPAGNVVEYTTELELVDEDTWQVRRFASTPEAADQWGTGGLITDAMIPAMFNEPDGGLWTPVPV